MWLLFMLSGIALTLLVTQRLTGFRSRTTADFQGRSPEFDPRHHLDGPLLCEGVIYGPTGRVSSRFVADMHGTWDGDTGTLAETFRYDSGVVQNRLWTLRLQGASVRADAPDLVGSGTGQIAGPALRLRYRIRLAQDAGGHVLAVTDWMYLMDNGTIINRSQFTKFGITVAEMVATIRRVGT
jgi:hypothetical protein